MAEFYSTGLVSINNGDTTVVGDGTTLWLSTNVKAGDAIELGGQIKLILSVTDTHHLELAVPYSGSDLTTVAYAIEKTSSNWGTTRTVAVDTAKLIQDIILGMNFAWVVSLSHPDSVIGAVSPVEEMDCPQNVTVSKIWITLHSGASSGIVTVDILKNGTSIFTTMVTIDATETSSLTAAIPCVILDPNWNQGDKLQFNIMVSGVNAIGLKAYILGQIQELTP